MSEPILLLLDVVQHGPRAGGPLCAWVGEHRALAKVPHELRRDVEQAVCLKLLSSARSIFWRIVARESELAEAVGTDGARVRSVSTALRAGASRRFSGYVRTMLENCHVDWYRRNPISDAEPVDEIVDDGSVEQEVEEVQILEHGRSTLEKAMAHSELADQRDALEQVAALAMRETTMDALVAAELGVADPERDEHWIRARNRLFSRHRRARSALERAIEDYVVNGTISLDDGEMLLRLVRRFLTRRQIDDPSTSDE